MCVIECVSPIANKIKQFLLLIIYLAEDEIKKNLTK